MQIVLVVLHSFLGHAVGETITDAEAIAVALESYPAHVVRKLIPAAEPAPAPVPASLELPETPALKA
jgi:ribosomal protein S12 methylthiotransferase accessory factor YcaO